MTKIKKISAIMVAAVILCTCFLMSGCGGNTESSSSEKATSTVKLKLSFMRNLLRLQSRTLLTLQKTAFMTVLLSTESLPAL